MSAKIRLLRIAAGLTLIVALAAVSMPSYAYRMIQNLSPGRSTAGALVSCTNLLGFAHWDSSETDWYINPFGQGLGKSAAFVAAMARWTAVVPPTHVLNFRGVTSGGFNTDGINTLSWGTGVGCSGNCLALTALVLLPGQEIIEADITFNNAVTWTTTGAAFDTEAVATHELGHALGIHHTNKVASFPRPTMYAFYSGSGMRSLESDDVAALVCSYIRYNLEGDPPNDDPEPPPPGPPTVRVLPQWCFDFVRVEWDAIPGAIRYELYKANNSDFSGQTKVYDGTALGHSLRAGSGTSYFRLRGCNADFCGDYRDGDRSFKPTICH